MSQFTVTVTRIRAIEPIPGADFIELAVVGEYRSVVKKGQFGPGDLTAYIPEAALIPPDVLSALGLTGKLAGSGHNRVKAARFKGCLSQGICYPATDDWVEHQDVSALLGIEKYLPPIPMELAGQLFRTDSHTTISYDIENWKKYPTLVQDGEMVVFTEKLHGTWCQATVLPFGVTLERGNVSGPEDDQGFGPDLRDRVVISSKGPASSGLAFKLNEANTNNIYIRAMRQYEVPQRIARAFENLLHHGYLIIVLGEILGVQDLKYGAHPRTPGGLLFRVFDLYMTMPGQPHLGHFLSDSELDHACLSMGLYRVPVLYRGPFTREILHHYTSGKESVSGTSLHIREGLVIRPRIERIDSTLPVGGRVQLKSISDNYVMRKGESTEFE